MAHIKNGSAVVTNNYGLYTYSFYVDNVTHNHHINPDFQGTFAQFRTNKKNNDIPLIAYDDNSNFLFLLYSD